METNKINIFSKPELIDTMVKTKLQQFPVRGGKTSSRKVKWSDQELEVIDNVIWQYMTEQGLSRERTAQQLHERWGIAMITARLYIKNAINRMANTYNENTDELRKIFLERCENIIQEALESRQKDTALKAMDLMAKSLGFYKEQKDINVSGESTIKFDFS